MPPQYIDPHAHDEIGNLQAGEFALPNLDDWAYQELAIAQNTVGAMRTNMIQSGIAAAANWVPEAPENGDLENLQNEINDLISGIVERCEEPADEILVEIFHRIQLWGGNTGRNIYLQNNGFDANFDPEAYRTIFLTATAIEGIAGILPAMNSFQQSVAEIQSFGLSFASKHISFFSLAAHEAIPDRIHVPIFDSNLSKGCFGRNFPTFEDFTSFAHALNDPEEQPIGEYSVKTIERSLFNFFARPEGEEWIRLRFQVGGGNPGRGRPPQPNAPRTGPSGGGGGVPVFSQERSATPDSDEPNPPTMCNDPIQAPHPQCVPIPQWADIDSFYVFAHHSGQYITLRESPNGNRNNAWINTHRHTIDFHTHPSHGLRKDLWAKINCCTNHELNLPENVEVVKLQGPTQHNGGAGYSVGLKGFISTEQILRYIRRYVYLFSAPSNPEGTPYNSEYLGSLTPLE